LSYPLLENKKSQTLSGFFENREIGQTLSAQSQSGKPQTVSGELSLAQISQTLSGKLPLSWSHYLFLIGITNPDERRFYELEAANEGWSLRELKRQFASSLYERLALSRDKAGVKELSEKGQLLEKHDDVIKDPYVLEFLGLDEKTRYSETELETAIIDKLEHFLLELGKGFLFEARQKRFTFDEEHFFVDLVFYNRLLRCYVIIDLKIGELKHQDLGQMQMYVNYFDRYVKLEDEQETIGIILCKKKKDSLVEITLPEGANIHATKYQTYLPDKESLKKQLEEAQAEWEAGKL
jgi:predicted nuclease of restriction endonuclease-like (RecB) superfamily